MAKIDHPNIGDIAKTKYLIGTITEITDNDTCSINISGQLFTGVPIFYHCANDSVLQSNGSLEGAAGAFAQDDEVIAQLQDGIVRVIGHADGVKRPCAVDWLVKLFDNNDNQFHPPSDFTFPLFGILLDIWVFDKADIDIGFNCQFNEFDAFQGFWNTINPSVSVTPDPAVHRGSSLGGAGLGSYASGSQILKFASNPPGWSPSGTPSGEWVIFIGGLYLVTYEDLTSWEFVSGDIMVPGATVYEFIRV